LSSRQVLVDMKLLFLLIVLGLLAVLLPAVLRNRRGRALTGSLAKWPYQLKKPLSVPEQVLYHRLVQALPEHLVLAQVQMSRVLGVRHGADFAQWHNRIHQKTFDFVVCTKDARVIGAIELDDRSHDAHSRRSADAVKNRACADAGLRLVRWHVRNLPDVAAIQREFPPPVAGEFAASTAPGTLEGRKAA
jgi:hypothetical protein